MKYFAVILALLLLATAGLFGVAYCVLKLLVMRKPFYVPPQLGRLIRGSEAPTDYARDSKAALRRFRELPIERVSLTAPDGACLRGKVLTPTQANGKLILALHGARSSGEGEFCFFATDFFHKGYTLVLPDHRGCAESDGDFMGYGTHESEDAFLWLDYARQKFPEMDIYVLGVSMGGATALMMSNHTKIREVRGIIADCSYTSAWDEFSYQMKSSLHLTEFPLLYVCDFLNERLHHYSFKDASALKAVRRAQTPILFIHGAKDAYVPTYMQGLLYDECPSEKYKLTVPGALHARSYYKDPALYTKAVETFIRQTSIVKTQISIDAE